MIATGRAYSYNGIVGTASRPPLYPAVIAALMRVTNHPHIAIVAVQIACGTATVALAASLASRAFGRRAGLITGSALALAPMSAHFTSSVMSETIFTFLIVASMWAWQADRTAAAGVALGLAALTRPIAQPFIIALAISAALFRRAPRQRQRLRIAAFAMLTLAPWIARNVIQSGRFIVSDGSWGASLAYGAVELHSGSNRNAQVAAALNFHALPMDTPPAGELPAIRLVLRRAAADPTGWIRARLSQYPWLLIDTGDYFPTRINAVTFFNALRNRHFAPVMLKLSFIASNLLVLALAARGVWFARRRAADLVEVWLFPAFVLVAQLPVWVEPRFAVPIVPFLVMFAAAGLAELSVYAGEISQ
jgi:4-amino-4-deoxy-L-arabinose transferase-like glycosyltransferase